MNDTLLVIERQVDITNEFEVDSSKSQGKGWWVLMWDVLDDDFLG